MAKVGPHVIVPTAAALDWSRRAPCVVALDDPAPFHVAQPNALRVWRRFFPYQDVHADPQSLANQILDGLGGYRHPRLYCQVFVGLSKETIGAYIPLLQKIVPILHAAGVKVAGPSLYSGDFDATTWAALRAADWCGLDLAVVQGYWASKGPTVWNALRYRQFWRPGDPPIFLGECGRDKVRDGDHGEYIGSPGWKSQGIGGAEYVAELFAFDLELQADPYIWGAAVFSAGTRDGEWRDFDTDGLNVNVLASPPYIPGGDPVPEQHTAPTLALWVWNWQDAYLDVARKIGATHILAKAADGLDLWTQYSPAAALIRRAGMVPVPWAYNYGNAAEPAVLEATGERLVCFDPEIEFERVARPAQQAFCRAVQGLRDRGIEVWSACWGQPAVHRDYPWRDLGYAIDRWLPMIAWRDWTPREVGHWLDTWDTAQMGNATPWLPAYDGVTADELVASVREAQRRYRSASIWAAHTLTAEMVLKLAGAVEKPAPDLNPELARFYALSASLAQLAADVKAKVGA